MNNRKKLIEYRTFSDFYNDETNVNGEMRERIEFEVALIKKLVEARESKGIKQSKLSEMSGITQPSIARLEKGKISPQIDTIFQLLLPLGYTLEIVPFKK